MKEKYLPVGTVVLLKDGKQYMAITGYKVRDDMYNVYDYCGCIFPVGYTTPSHGVFNHNQIQEVAFEGYRDESFEELNKKLIEYDQQNT